VIYQLWMVLVSLSVHTISEIEWRIALSRIKPVAYTYWKTRIGKSVMFTGELKALDPGTVGVLDKVHDDWCVIVYPQNSAYEDDGKGGFKPRKGAPNKVYSHSCKLTEIKECS